jgi:hypothetical protein
LTTIQRGVPWHLALVLVLAWAAAAPAGPPAAPGQQVKPADDDTTPPPGAFRQEIWNGPNRTVRYEGKGLTPGEQATLRNLERAENEAAVADDLAALRREYVSNERVMENRRHNVQLSLYGYASSYGASAYAGSGFAAYPYVAPYGYPYVSNPFGYAGALAASSSTNSLAFGMGDEGAIKTEMARTLATEAASDRLALAARSLENARAQWAVWERLRSPKGDRNGGIIVAGNEQPDRGREIIATVILKGDQKPVKGTLVSENPEWVTVATDNEVMSVRMSEVVRIDRKRTAAKD